MLVMWSGARRMLVGGSWRPPWGDAERQKIPKNSPEELAEMTVLRNVRGDIPIDPNQSRLMGSSYVITNHGSEWINLLFCVRKISVKM